MDVKQALKLIDGLVATFRATREEHLQIQQAMEVIKSNVSLNGAGEKSPHCSLEEEDNGTETNV